MTSKAVARRLLNGMWYNLKRPRPILFDHLPKCGGSSINFFLRQNYPEKRVFETDGNHPQESVHQFKALTRSQQLKYKLVMGHCAHQLQDYVDPRAFRVTVFRDPVDRIVSHYFFVKNQPVHYLHKRVIEEGISLANYTTSGLSPELTNWYTAHFSGMTPKLITEEPQKALSRAIAEVRVSYDLVGFQDDIRGFLMELKTACGLWAKVPSERINVTAKRKSVKDLSEDERSNIFRSNATDIEFFTLLKEAVVRKTI